MVLLLPAWVRCLVAASMILLVRLHEGEYLRYASKSSASALAGALFVGPLRLANPRTPSLHASNLTWCSAQTDLVNSMGLHSPVKVHLRPGDAMILQKAVTTGHSSTRCRIVACLLLHRVHSLIFGSCLSLIFVGGGVFPVSHRPHVCASSLQR